MKDVKIDSVRFYDYRAFFNGKDNDYLIKVDGKNLLVYGENGSGKTSFFRGLKDFVYCHDFITHNQTPRESKGFIEVGFTDEAVDRFEESGGKPSKPEILNTAKLNSFLSYKELLKTHLFDSDIEINFFDLLVNEMLANHSLNSLGELGRAWGKVNSISLEKETKKLEDSLNKEEINDEEFQELFESLHKSSEDNFKDFKSELDLLISQVNGQLEVLLPYFNQDLDVELSVANIDYVKYDEAEISLNVKLFGKEVPSHHDFLNEARLSALAISIYLSALKLNPTSDAVKLLFLDDIFLGLDTGNRIPLLNIINAEFNDWQIFITTYDRHWFEIAKSHLKGNWQKIEMFAGVNEDGNFEIPVILDESLNHLQRAKKYFSARDYSACSNYIRKEIERVVKSKLPERKKRSFDGKPHALSHLWDVLNTRYSALGKPIDKEINRVFKTLSSMLLNPSSHDSLAFPIYKGELYMAFELIKKIDSLPSINNLLIMAAGTNLTFQHPSENYSFNFYLREDWVVDVCSEAENVIYPKCGIVEWQYNEEFFWNFKKEKIEPEKNIERVKLKKDNLIKVLENLEERVPLKIDRSMLLNYTLVAGKWSLGSYMENLSSKDLKLSEIVKTFFTSLRKLMIK